MSKRGVNMAVVLGNLGDDPEVRYTPAGKAVCNFSVATSESWKDKNTGEAQTATEWHRCVAYDKLCEIIGEYAKKGSKLYVKGKLKTRKWQGQDGQDRYTTEIIVEDFQLLDGKPQESGQAPQQQKRQPVPQSKAPPKANQSPVVDNFDDDIPFMDPYKFAFNVV